MCSGSESIGTPPVPFICHSWLTSAQFIQAAGGMVLVCGGVSCRHIQHLLVLVIGAISWGLQRRGWQDSTFVGFLHLSNAVLEVAKQLLGSCLLLWSQQHAQIHHHGTFSNRHCCCFSSEPRMSWASGKRGGLASCIFKAPHSLMKVPGIRSFCSSCVSMCGCFRVMRRSFSCRPRPWPRTQNHRGWGQEKTPKLRWGSGQGHNPVGKHHNYSCGYSYHVSRFSRGRHLLTTNEPMTLIQCHYDSFGPSLFSSHSYKFKKETNLISPVSISN